MVKLEPWARLRGAGGEGDASSVRPPDLSLKGIVKWTLPLPGTGHASCVEWGRFWFTCTAEPVSGVHMLHCIDPGKKTIAWTIKSPFSTYHRHDFNTFASSTPAVGQAGGVALIPSGNTELQLIGFSYTGQKRWAIDLGKFPTQHGYGASPVISGNIAIAAAEPDFAMGGIIAVNVLTGKILWHHKRLSADAPYAAPLVTKLNGKDTVVVPSTAFGLTALDLVSGEMIWQLKRTPFTQRCVGAVTRSGDMLVVTTGSGAGARLAIGFQLQDSGPPVQKWSLNRATSYVPTPLIIGSDALFWGDNGVLLRVNTSSGTTVYQERIGDNAFASPIHMQGAILNITRKGEIVRISDQLRPHPVDLLPLGEESHASLSVFGNQLVARTLSKVHVLG